MWAACIENTKGWPEPCEYGAHTLTLAGESSNIWSCTVYILKRYTVLANHDNTQTHTKHAHAAGLIGTAIQAPCPNKSCVGLARNIYIRFTYGIFGREITKYTVIYGVHIRFWPTLFMCLPLPFCKISSSASSCEQSCPAQLQCVSYIFPCI